jgi:8-oxo-dGTP pyrophosphatase MutT (NUDIX family)
MPRPSDVGVGTACIIYKIVGRKFEVLFMKRQGAHCAGQWAVPGGWLDRPDETTQAAVCREVEEETGLILEKSKVHQYQWTTEDHPSIGCRSVTLYHTVELPDGQEPQIKEPHKCSEMRWVGFDELTHYVKGEPMFPGLDKILIDFYYGLSMMLIHSTKEEGEE